jgi:hypothetical protein
MTRPAVNLDDLSAGEQMDLLEEIWDRLSQHEVRERLKPR